MRKTFNIFAIRHPHPTYYQYRSCIASYTYEENHDQNSSDAPYQFLFRKWLPSTTLICGI